MSQKERQNKVRTLLIPIPPREEQDRLIQATSVETEPIDVAIARTEREILLMQECRTRQVADVVTGKLDVRLAAAQLPDLTPPSPAAATAGYAVEPEPEETE